MTEPIPLLDLGAQHHSLHDELVNAFERVLQSGEFILGREVAAFEAEIASFLKCKHAIGVSSGSDALLAALMALDIGPGDEVITPAFSFFATAGCVARLGAKPVFVDIDPETYNLDPNKIEHAVTSHTKAIIPVHLYGQPCDMQDIQSIATARRLAIVEDAAQAIGAQTSQGPVGTLGSFGCFSFFPSKNLGCLGDGGLITTQDDALAKHARILRAHGSEPKYHHHVIGGNFRIDAVQAAFLRVKLKRLPQWIQARQAHAQTYDQLFKQANLEPPLVSIPRRKHASHVYHQYVIRTSRRPQVIEQMTSEHIGHAIYYPEPLHLQPCFRYLGYAPGSLPHTELACEQTLALPMFPELTHDQQSRVVQSIVQALSTHP